MAGAAHVPLGELCRIVPGPSGSWLHGMTADLDDGVPVITPPDITDQNTVDVQGIKRVGKDAADAMAARYRLAEGDIVLVRQAVTGLGRRALVGPGEAGWLFATSCVRITATSGRLLPEYLLHYLGDPTVRASLDRLANPGQAVNTLTVTSLARLAVVLPDLASQRALAGALDAIDEQLACNAAQNRRLAQLGQALLTEQLKDWRGEG
ncbi:hypothetical protein RM780_25645 [Streptomyces sp. DSM 44917]|uniref:Type I restriction modification DNA specificity domain-containing protein n=1 Tax=Streptomyces boetiae TaxID=3075541 RepID=A0ABU2LFD4_9ACTN|nr:hypothetical protein [Streptomyces sp. DSM 44917]MDT0310307.1 hypothetical protein [Streptomyces sp. DSM 44917]